MTTERVTLADQIAAIRGPIAYAEHLVDSWRDHPNSSACIGAKARLAAFRAILATLQQYERAMAALRPFAEIADAYAAVAYREGRKHHSDGHRVSVGLGECRAARAALDDAASATGDAG